MEQLDWIIFLAYLVFVFVVGIWVTKKASTGIESYFVADRSLPWWWLGISIIATTFAADTPLAITGLTANNGIVGNWFWWSWAATYITVAIFFAKRWRKSEVLTDVAFIEMRYDGQQAAFLRAFKAFFFGIVLNCFILGWVITAAVKIAGPFIQWQEWLPNFYNFALAYYPTFLLFKGDLNATLTIVSLIMVVLGYSSLGGIRGVILTDLFQFAIAMITSILFAYYAIDYVGGMGNLQSTLVETYGAAKAAHYTEFLPSFDNPLLPFQVFLIYIIVQWWVRYDSDGTGYIAQRINTAKNPKEAQKGSLLFAIAFLALRSWPWILVALASLVIFPFGNEGLVNAAMGEQVLADREMAYPLIMKLILPVGLLGLTFTSLMAAFMSTVDTHLNWGASYMVNDIYRRFINPEASQKNLIGFSRWMVLVITILAIIVASQMTSISGAWKFFINAAAGLGVAQIIRWFWWRANAYTEIASMITALVLTIIISYTKPESAGAHYDTYALAGIALACLIVSVVVSLTTKPVSTEVLKTFVKKCQPVGWWRSDLMEGGEASVNNKASILEFGNSIIMWVLGITLSFAGLFSIGYFLMLQPVKGVLSAALCLGAYVILNRMIEKENQSFQ